MSVNDFQVKVINGLTASALLSSGSPVVGQVMPRGHSSPPTERSTVSNGGLYCGQLAMICWLSNSSDPIKPSVDC